MLQTINIPNYNLNNLLSTVAQTRLDADIAAGVSTIVVLNSASYNIGDFILLGTAGSETAELVTIQSITDANTIVTTFATKLPHSKYDYVNLIFGDKINVYRALNVNGVQPSDGAYSKIGTATIKVDSAMTQYSDDGGSGDYWYRFTYFNSVKVTETNLADSNSTRGGGSGDYCSIDAVRLEAGFRNAKYITDDMIDAKRQAAQSEINSALQGFYPIPFVKPINPFISDICVRLASGLLLLEQYGAINTMNTADGTAKLKAARDDLHALATKQKVLTDILGKPIATDGSTGGVSSSFTDPEMTPRAFSMDDLQGYYGRKY